MSDGDAEDTVVIYSTLTDSADLWHAVTQMDQFQFSKSKQSAYQNVSRVRSADSKDSSSSVELNILIRRPQHPLVSGERNVSEKTPSRRRVCNAGMCDITFTYCKLTSTCSFGGADTFINAFIWQKNGGKVHFCKTLICSNFTFPHEKPSCTARFF